MNKTVLIAIAGMMAVLALCVTIIVGAGISANNYGVRAEASIESTYKDNQNILSNYAKKVAETVQVPAMYRDDLIKAVSASMSGRYGPSGSNASMQWLKEMNIPVDASIYKQIQQVIEAGRNDFRTGQTRLIDEKRAYKTELGTFPRSIALSVLGFPKIDFNKYDIVTDDRTNAAFDTKIEAPLQLRAPDAPVKK